MSTVGSLAVPGYFNYRWPLDQDFAPHGPDGMGIKGDSSRLCMIPSGTHLAAMVVATCLASETSLEVRGRLHNN